MQFFCFIMNNGLNMLSRKQWLFVCGILWGMVVTAVPENEAGGLVPNKLQQNQHKIGQWFCESILNEAQNYNLVVCSSMQVLSQDVAKEIAFYAAAIQMYVTDLVGCYREIDRLYRYRNMAGEGTEMFAYLKSLERTICRLVGVLRLSIKEVLGIFDAHYGVFVKRGEKDKGKTFGDFRFCFDYQWHFLDYISQIHTCMHKHIRMLECVVRALVKHPNGEICFELEWPYVVVAPAKNTEYAQACRLHYKRGICGKSCAIFTTKGRCR